MSLLFVLPFVSSVPLLTRQQVPKKYVDMTYTDPWKRELAGVDACTAEAFDQFREALIDDFEKGWEKLMKYDWASTRSYLTRETPQYPLSVVHWMETRNSGTGGYDRAFSEVRNRMILSSTLTLNSNRSLGHP